MENENILIEYGLQLQKIITHYHSLYNSTHVEKKEFLRVSTEPLTDEIAKLNVNTVNELIIHNDMIINQEVLESVNKLSLQSVVNFVCTIK